MHRRETTNHNDKYVLYYEFDDERDRLTAIEEPPVAREADRDGD
ncbi:MAG: hypothetical protein ABEI98_08125 [Halorhabdus sp.]